MSEKSTTNKAKSKVTPAAKTAKPNGEFPPHTPAQTEALGYSRDAWLDSNILTMAYIAESMKWQREPDYEGTTFSFADFDELVKRGLLSLNDGIYKITSAGLKITDPDDPDIKPLPTTEPPVTTLELTPVETNLIKTLRVGKWDGVLDNLVAIHSGKATLDAEPSKEPDYELISFRAPDPTQPYGYDYGDSVMPHELIAMSIVHDLTLYMDLPRQYSVADGEIASNFLETIIGAIEGAFQCIDAIELAQLVVAIHRDKSRYELG